MLLLLLLLVKALEDSLPAGAAADEDDSCGAGGAAARVMPRLLGVPSSGTCRTAACQTRHAYGKQGEPKESNTHQTYHKTRQAA